MKNLLLIVNPVAGKAQGKSRLFEMVDIFSNHGYRVSVLPTSSEGKTEQDIIKEIKKYNLAVAVGGDGTLNSTVNGLVKSGCDIPLGYIPLGSTNDVGYSLGLKGTIKKCCERIATSEPKYIDVGKFGEKYFVYIACTGILTGASYNTPQKFKNVFGHSAYVLEGVSELAKMPKQKHVVELENETIEGEFIFAGIMNTLRLAGVFSLDKLNVGFDDGLFELCLIKGHENSLKNFSLIGDMITSNFTTDNFVSRKIKKAVIRLEKPSIWALDGENGGEFTETVIEVKEKALRLIY